MIPVEEELAVPIAWSAERREADEWALVLDAADVRCRVVHVETRWALAVAESDASRARALLDDYRAEVAARPVQSPEPSVPEYGPSVAGVVLAVLLLAFHGVTGSFLFPVQWHRVGSASAARILEGEVWRVVTALTLHRDAAHVLGNGVFCAIFATALFRAVGPGVGLWLALLAGAGGNGINALWRGPPHVALGASTALFGALGALAGVRFRREGGPVRRRRRAWLAVAAALGLLALLGSSAETDVLAHFFGFLVGLGLGATVAVLHPNPAGGLAQAALGATALGVVAAGWALALL